jgi:long-chain acyl-CoA synthetase
VSDPVRPKARPVPPGELGLWNWAAVDPDRPAMITQAGRTLSFAELAELANQSTHGLRAAGCQVGDTIAVMLPNDVELMRLFLGAIQGGFYITIINYHLMPAEVAYVLEDCGARLFVGDARYAEAASAAVAALPRPPERLYSVGAIPGFRPIAELTDGMPRSRPADRHLGDRMQYTSGTTGKPKGVRRKLQDVDVDVAISKPGPPFGIRAGDGVHLITGPMYHSAPTSVGSQALNYGNTLVVMDKWSAAETVRLIQQYGVTHTHMVPTMFHRLLRWRAESGEQISLPSLETVVHGAAPISPGLKKQMIEWWGPIFCEYFGSTEISGTVVDSRDWLAHPGTVGKPWDGVELKVLDVDGNDCPAGVPGRIYFRAPNRPVFEYHNNAKDTNAGRIGEFVTVGDIGYLDAEGWLYPCDRAAHMIISGGVNIYPAEVEAVLLEHRLVSDAAVVGIPNEEWGEEVKAVVELMPGATGTPELAEELVAYTRSRIAHFKCPRSVDFDDQLPRDANGKMYKRLVRERYWEGRESRII